MSTRNVGMVGKTYTSASEAFKDATWSTAIEMPNKSEYDHLWAIGWVILALFAMVWVFTRF
jgi:hypothetical protein